MDPNPDYDASDEIEYGMNWFAWILRGVYPPPAYPPVLTPKPAEPRRLAHTTALPTHHTARQARHAQ